MTPSPHARPQRWGRTTILSATLCCSAVTWLAGCSGGSQGGAGPEEPPPQANRPPVAPASIADQSATERVAFGYTVPAFTDPDGDTLTYTFSGLPTWLSVQDAQSAPRTLVGTPPDTAAEPGSPATFSVTVAATDPAGASASAAFTITVTDGTAPLPATGLDARPSNQTCLAPERPQPATGVQLTRVFPALTFASPVHLLQAPSDGSRWFVVEQAGRVRVFGNEPTVASSSVFIDIASRVVSGGEQGLLGMAFHPDWPATPEVFLSYTRSSPTRQSVISRFSSADGGQTLDPAAEQVLLTVDQPYSNHNGGHIEFGPDGLLYIGLGDGGSGGDPQNNAQTLTNLLGSVLRIDVNGTGAGYDIPAGNPYAGNAKCSTGAGTAPCPEMWAFGFRNPWRWSFDRQTGQLWMGDVGQNAWEEVNRVTAGGNYGWRQREATHCYNPATGCAAPGQVLNGGTVIDPVTEYGHDASGGQSITGGYVYRGSDLPALSGQYVFGDYVSGRVWSHTPGAGNLQKTELLVAGFNISSFGTSVDDELYVLRYGDGAIFKFEPAGAGTDPIADNLADTGCVDPADPTRPASGLIPYAPNAPFWSDGAEKERFIGLPDGATIAETANRDWDFPNGTVLVKNFRLQGKLIETRLFMRHPDGVWGGYTYEWNDAETGATRVMGGKDKLVGTQTWTYPSEAQCLQCHTQAAGRSLGLETAQQNGDFTYPSTGRTANQVVTLNAIGAISPAIPGTPADWPALADPYGSEGSITDRARAWLHSNCSQCHRPGGNTPTDVDFRYQTALASTNACDVAPSGGDLGVADARLIAPGDPDRSVVVTRIETLDPQHRMPPVGSNVVDAAGVRLLRDWIGQLSGCN
jgi:uncharacterized repeat protein (TIGR03806 family)